MINYDKGNICSEPDSQFVPEGQHRNLQIWRCLLGLAHLVRSKEQSLMCWRSKWQLTFLNITKGSSIRERTLRVILGGRPSVKAYLSVITRPFRPLHSPTFCSFSDFNFNKSSLKSTLRPSLNLKYLHYELGFVTPGQTIITWLVLSVLWEKRRKGNYKGLSLLSMVAHPHRRDFWRKWF